ncbi:interleukin-7 isoform X1 [Urocitellus parryii]|uniref:interleukin-7 isoform X1 n=1 Tax=Urocitellus parryii TaxID=9999 RepID=UPI000E55C22D|nr:interleukin-7 isoform X1 [Urocitellus parryii]
MFHVSFRYIFGIPPLILALLPVTSSDCDIKGKEGKEFEHVLMISFNELLDKMIEVDSNCVNNESNFFKRHSCGDSKEAAFLNRAARKLNQFLKMNMSEDFQLHLSRISEGTLKLLSCPSKEEKNVKEQKKNDPCFLKTLLQKIKTCWNKILRGNKEH